MISRAQEKTLKKVDHRKITIQRACQILDDGGSTKLVRADHNGRKLCGENRTQNWHKIFKNESRTGTGHKRVWLYKGSLVASRKGKWRKYRIEDSLEGCNQLTYKESEGNTK